MRSAEQQSLIDRTLRLVEAGDSERGTGGAIPIGDYLDPERFRQEQERVFRRFPVAVAPAARLARPGDSLAIDVAGMPLLLVRDAGGVLRGFVNACRHRGARLQGEGAHTGQRVLVCPYHSWTYALDGALRGRPHERDFAHVPAADCHLARVPTGEALGFAWVVPRVVDSDDEAGIDLAAWLGRFGEDLRHWGCDRWVPFDERAFDNAANWKVPFDGNLETYHVRYAHRDTIAALFHDNLLVADQDAPHQRLFLPKRSLASLREQPRSDWDVRRHANIIYCFFPATLILFGGDHCHAFSVLPQGVGRSRIVAATLVPEAPASEKARVHWEKNVASFWGALVEDFALGESLQSTLASGANTVLRFGATEQASLRFHADVAAALEGRLADAPLRPLQAG